MMNGKEYQQREKNLGSKQEVLSVNCLSLPHALPPERKQLLKECIYDIFIPCAAVAIVQFHFQHN